MKVSFIIPHNGRYNLLLETIESLIALNFDKADYEAIIVSQDDNISLSILNGIDTKGLKINIVRYKGESVSALRNYGFNLSSGEYVAFIDADIALSANWIQKMLDELKDPSVVIASAYQNVQGDNKLETLRASLNNIDIDCDKKFLSGSNLFLHRNTFTKVGGFPESMKSCEDYYFTGQAADLGRLRYISSASHIHLGEDKDYKTLWKKELWRGQSNLLTMKGRAINLRELPSIAFPVIVLFLLLIALSSVFFFDAYIVVILLSISLFIPVLYSCRLAYLAKRINIIDALKFYLVYFVARGIGSLKGVFKSFDLK